ncbi:MAG: hypothetical protein PHX43_00760 [Alphaproteobacteria bacterium]|nr:hypothetical protein [Alphaproteobacteria bacterium]
MPKASILIGTPCYGGMVTHVYMQSIIKLMSYAASRDIELNLALLAHDSLVTRSRNTILANFLDTPRMTHLLFIDADTGFEPEQVERMLDFDKDLVAGMYPIRVIHWPQVQKRISADTNSDELPQLGLNYVGIPCKGEEKQEIDGFVTGTYAGTGFMLMKRSVAESMAKAYPETKYKAMQTYPLPKHPSPNQYNLFDCMIDPDTGTYLSEDFTFCYRWRKMGGKIWLDQRGELVHVGSYEFSGNPMTRVGA